MATRRSATRVADIGLMTAGVAEVVLFLFSYLSAFLPSVLGGLVAFVAAGALAVGLGALGLRVVRDSRQRAAFTIAAVGWLGVAVLPYVPFGSVLSTLALIVAGAAGLVGGILVFRAWTFGRGTSVRLLVAMAFGAGVALGAVIPLFGGLFTLGFGVALIVTAIAFRND